MGEDFKRALRENRYGKIRVPIDSGKLGAFKEAMALLERRVMVISREPIDDAYVWYKGYSPDFEPQPLGATMPEYLPTFRWLEPVGQDDQFVGELVLDFRMAP